MRTALYHQSYLFSSNRISKPQNFVNRSYNKISWKLPQKRWNTEEKSTGLYEKKFDELVTIIDNIAKRAESQKLHEKHLEMKSKIEVSLES